MTSRSEHPVAIVTGGCGGIGSAVVDALTGRGLRVAVFDLPRPGPEYEPGKNVLFREVDITDSTAVASAVDSVVDDLGRLDVVVNNAAVLECYAVHDTPESVWDRVFDVNVKGTFLVSRASIPHLRKAGNASVVNVSSVHAHASIPRTAAYAASKGAIISLSRQMAVEYAEDGIRVNCVVVGSVDTSMSTQHGEAIRRDNVSVSIPTGRLGRMGGPDEVASAIAYLAMPEASFITGAAVHVDGGLLARLM